MLHQADFLILTNNPLVVKCLGNDYEIRFEKDYSYRDILIEARDLVYKGHTLYTHPLSGSVKPNETPYKSIVVSDVPHGFNADMANMMGGSIQVFDKFTPKNRELTQKLLRRAERLTPDIPDSLYALGEIEYVNLVTQNDEVSN